MKLNKKIKFLCAIDGYSGSGKTTGSKIIAKHFGFKFLTSGLLYRWVAYNLLKKNKTISDKKFLKKITENINLKKLRNKKLYEPKITDYTSQISKIKFIRNLLRKFQKDFAKQRLAIIEGRDIGSVVLREEADLKLFFKCSLKVKAKRRLKDYIRNNKKITLLEVKKSIKTRDFRDTHRKVNPLKIPRNAVIVDTSKMNIKQMEKKLTNIVLRAIKKKYGKNI